MTNQDIKNIRMNFNKVIIDCERMKYPYTGLYEYCRQLSIALYRQKDQINGRLCFYTPKSELGFAGHESNYLIQKSLHKFFNPFTLSGAIWHTTYQGSMYFPISSKVKKVLTIHDLNFLYDDKKSASKIKKYLAALQDKIKRADSITVISQFTLSEVTKHLNTFNKPIEIIHNGCNLNTANVSEHSPAFIKSNAPFLFTIGTVARKKNFHVLPSLLKNNDYVLIISGVIQEESYCQQIMNEAKRFNVTDRVFITGPVSETDKNWLLKNAAFFVFPSIAEGFGIPVVEAMSFGTPVITSDYTALPEIAGVEGYYFRSFDPDDMLNTLADSLNDFNRNPNKKSALIERAKMFDWNIAATKYRTIYNSLLS
jgi:glycosyltransferase involved in cell wall biosynthesis